MDASQNFPPPPREMYNYQHQQEVNGRSLALISPSAAATPPCSEYVGYISDIHPQQQFMPQHGYKIRPKDNHPIPTLRTSLPQISNSCISHENTPRINLVRGRSPQKSGADNKMNSDFNSETYHQIVIKGPVIRAKSNTNINQRRELSEDRLSAQSQNLLIVERDGRTRGAFHPVHRSKSLDRCRSKKLELVNVGHHKPTLTYVPPPVVPILNNFSVDILDSSQQQRINEYRQRMQLHQQNEQNRLRPQQRMDEIHQITQVKQPSVQLRVPQHSINENHQRMGINQPNERCRPQQQQQQLMKENHQILQLHQQNEPRTPEQERHFVYHSSVQQKVQEHHSMNNNDMHRDNSNQINYQNQRHYDNSNHSSSDQKQQHCNSPPASLHLSHHPSAFSSAISPSSRAFLSMQGYLKVVSTPDQRPTHVSPAQDTHFISHVKPPPLSPKPSESAHSLHLRSPSNEAPLIRPSPVSLVNPLPVNLSTSPHQLLLPSPHLHLYQYKHVDFQPIDNPHDHNHQGHHALDPPLPPPPPPPPPLRISSTLQPPTHLGPDFKPSIKISEAPKTASPTGRENSSQENNLQVRLATVDDLVNVKLRSVKDSSPKTSFRSPTPPKDVHVGRFRLLSAPAEIRNIHTKGEATLSPPPLDNFDEFPPPPPPHELLYDFTRLTSSSPPSNQRNITHSATLLAKPHPPIPAGEANSSQISHQHTHLLHPIHQLSELNPSPAHQDSCSTAKHTHSEKASNEVTRICSPLSERHTLMSNTDFEIPADIDLSNCPGLVEITKNTPNWKRDMIEKKNQEKIEEYVKQVLKEKEQEAKWKNVPEWKKKILQKKEEEDSAASTVKPTSASTGKKPGKKPPVPPPKDANLDLSSQKHKGDIVPAALSIDPEELAAMPPWKRELLFKRDKVPVTFSNEYNPDEEEGSEFVPGS